MKNPSLSIIIPTYNRKDILKKCLNALFNQTYLCSNYEIIVIDDGSTDETEELVKSLLNDSRCNLQYFKQEKNKGPGAARNIGIKNAEGEIILFIGDDIIATPTLLEEHSLWHQQYPNDNIGVLGYITWSPEIQITPFMKWLENGGPQFAFWQIKEKIDVDAQNYFYTSNISLKKKFLLETTGFFDEEFPYAAFEDNELGYRLKKRGLVLKYYKKAIAYHYHYTSLAEACRRMIKVGESQQILATKMGKEYKKCHSKKLLQRILNQVKFSICYLLAKFYEKKAIKERVFGYIMSYHRFIGVEKYRNKIK